MATPDPSAPTPESDDALWASVWTTLTTEEWRTVERSLASCPWSNRPATTTSSSATKPEDFSFDLSDLVDADPVPVPIAGRVPAGTDFESDPAVHDAELDRLVHLRDKKQFEHALVTANTHRAPTPKHLQTMAHLDESIRERVRLLTEYTLCGGAGPMESSEEEEYENAEEARPSLSTSASSAARGRDPRPRPSALSNSGGAGAGQRKRRRKMIALPHAWHGDPYVPVTFLSRVDLSANRGAAPTPCATPSLRRDATPKGAEPARVPPRRYAGSLVKFTPRHMELRMNPVMKETIVVPRDLVVPGGLSVDLPLVRRTAEGDCFYNVPPTPRHAIAEIKLTDEVLSLYGEEGPSEEERRRLEATLDVRQLERRFIIVKNASLDRVTVEAFPFHSAKELLRLLQLGHFDTHTFKLGRNGEEPIDRLCDEDLRLPAGVDALGRGPLGGRPTRRSADDDAGSGGGAGDDTSIADESVLLPVPTRVERDETAEEDFRALLSVDRDAPARWARFSTYLHKALEIRTFLTDRNYLVRDEMYRLQGLHVFYMTPEELNDRAKRYVEGRRQRKDFQSETDLVQDVAVPLQNYVILYLCATGSKLYTPRYVKMYADRMVTKGPPLSERQWVQLLDAYWWTKIAPREMRRDFEGIVNYYESLGLVVRLKEPHMRTGESRGRTSASGRTRVFNRSKQRFYEIVPSRHLVAAEDGTAAAHAKSQVPPRPRKQAFVLPLLSGSTVVPPKVVTGAPDSAPTTPDTTKPPPTAPLVKREAAPTPPPAASPAPEVALVPGPAPALGRLSAAALSILRTPRASKPDPAATSKEHDEEERVVVKVEPLTPMPTPSATIEVGTMVEDIETLLEGTALPPEIRALTGFGDVAAMEAEDEDPGTPTTKPEDEGLSDVEVEDGEHMAPPEVLEERRSLIEDRDRRWAATCETIAKPGADVAAINNERRDIERDYERRWTATMQIIGKHGRAIAKRSQQARDSTSTTRSRAPRKRTDDAGQPSVPSRGPPAKSTPPTKRRREIVSVLPPSTPGASC